VAPSIANAARPSSRPCASSLGNASARPCLPVHKGTRGQEVPLAVVEIATDGELVTVRRAKALRRSCGRPEPRAPSGNSRGRVDSWTKRSRLRLRRTLARIDSHARPTFVTLTWPTWQPHERADVDREWRAFRERFRRAFPRGSFVWKLEATQRGVPHWHLLVWTGEPSSPYATMMRLRAWFDGAWRWRTNVQTPRDSRAVRGYVGAYVWGRKAEYQNTFPVPLGRRWGYVGAIPWSRTDRLRVSDRVAVRIMRALRRCYGLRHRSANPTLSAIVRAPPDWLRLAAYYN